MTANEELYDAMVRHAIGVRRLSGSQVKKIVGLLDKSSEDIALKLSQRLNQGDFTSERFKALMKDITTARKEVFSKVLTDQKQGLKDLAHAEQQFAKNMLNSSLPVQLDYAVASTAQLGAIVNSTPFAGGPNAANTLSGWWSNLNKVDQGRITEAVQLGMVQGEDIPSIVKRVTTATDMTRRNAEAVVRTGVNHVSNQARESFFEANDGVVEALRWTSTLDGRTSPICRARDGHFAVIKEGVDLSPLLEPPTARPPAHVGCRSVMTAVLDAEGIADKIGDRPFVRDARTRRQREKDFRAEARADDPEKWKRMTPAERNAAIKDKRVSWTKENVGTVPATTTYDEWMRKQSLEFQNEVLGVQKAQAFRKGLKLDQFVDKRGSEMTLKQLSKAHPDFVQGKVPKKGPG
jgi:SPP1 gp7 family putative phage head morphogenesis protein